MVQTVQLLAVLSDQLGRSRQKMPRNDSFMLTLVQF